MGSKSFTKKAETHIPIYSPLRRLRAFCRIFILLACLVVQMPAHSQPLPNTAPLTMRGDLAAQMVESIDRYLMRETQIVAGNREKYWKRDTSSPEAYAKSIEPNRERFRKMIGLVDQ